MREIEAEVVEPVDWLLHTTEPIDSAEDVLRIVDFYRARWSIEEFFKAVKTGCAFQSRQLESLRTLQNALALFVPIAWGLLRLRTIARDDPELSAAEVLTPTQITILKKKSLLRGANPSAQQAMPAVAALGGHIKPTAAQAGSFQVADTKNCSSSRPVFFSHPRSVINRERQRGDSDPRHSG